MVRGVSAIYRVIYILERIHLQLPSVLWPVRNELHLQQQICQQAYTPDGICAYVVYRHTLETGRETIIVMWDSHDPRNAGNSIFRA